MQILNSPVTGKPMSKVALDQGLEAFHCPDSGGHYIPAASYMKWLEKQPARLPQLPESEFGIQALNDSSSARLCPESGTLMSRFKVGHGFTFSVDRSITGGIWLDGGEWEALRQRNFHDEIHLIFTAPWQRQIRDQQAQASYEDRLQYALGADLVARLESLRAELAGHPHRNLALAYLNE
jgi:Zn-finger nucleic acid-binding protein